MQARAGASFDLSALPYVGPDGTSNTFFTLPESSMIGAVPLGQYFQFRLVFDVEDGLLAPVFQGAMIKASRYPGDNPWVRNTAVNAPEFLGRLNSFEHVLAENVDIAVRYQISGNGTNWFWWNGSLWQEDVGGLGWTMANRSGAINDNIKSFYDQHYDKVGGRFYFKAFLHSEGNDQTAVDTVTLTYGRGRITVLEPNGVETFEKAWLVDTAYTIRWNSAGQVSNNLKIEYSRDGGANWTIIADGVANSSNYVGWVTPPAPSDQMLVRISDNNDPLIVDQSDSLFHIVDLFQVKIPNGGETFYLTETNRIFWSSPGSAAARGGRVDIRYSSGGTNFAFMVANGAPNTEGALSNSYSWFAPPGVYPSPVPSRTAKIRVHAFDNTDPAFNGQDDSDQFFTLAGITIQNPGPGSYINNGSDVSLTWVSAEAGGAVAVDFSRDDGGTWTNVLASIPNVDGSNSYLWAVNLAPSDTARVRIRSLSNLKVYGISGTFQLADIKLTAPTAEDNWELRQNKIITWEAGGAGDKVDLFYSVNGGSTWTLIESNVYNGVSNSYVWNVAPFPSAQARIRVVSQLDPINLRATSPDFDIAGVRIAFPNGGEIWPMGGTDSIRWEHREAGSEGGIYVSLNGGVDWTYLGARGLQNFSINWRPDYPTVRALARIDAVSPPPWAVNMTDQSDTNFTVGGVLITGPTNGQRATVGSLVNVNWLSAGALASGGDGFARIYYTVNGGASSNLVANFSNNENYPGNNSYPWNISDVVSPSTNAQVIVTAGPFRGISPVFVLRGMRFISPTSGTVADLGLSTLVRWERAGLDSSAEGSLFLSSDGGASFEPVAINPAPIQVSAGQYNWQIASNARPSTNAVLKFVITSSPTALDVNYEVRSRPFILRGLKVATPVAGAAWPHGSTNEIQVIAARAGDFATLYYSADGATFDMAEGREIARNVPITDGVNRVTWTIETDRLPSPAARIRAVSTVASGVSEAFELRGVKITRPFGTDIWAAGESNTITWVGQGVAGSYDVFVESVGQAPIQIANGHTSTSLTWLVSSAAVSTSVVIRVVDSGGYVGLSPAFRIVAEPTVIVIRPAASELLRVTDTYLLTWSRGGFMSNDFTVTYSVSPYAQINLITNGVALYDEESNTFTVPWTIPDDLGEARLTVVNNENPAIRDESAPFYIVGKYQLIYPVGGETDIFARKPATILWYTFGNVPFVNLYYSITPLHEEASWRLITNNVPVTGRGAEPSSYVWDVADLGGAVNTVRVRVEQSDRVGARDDSDADFAINYYEIVWNILDSLTGQHLNNLSVTESSGDSQSGLVSPILRKYPYGVFDTVWSREFFYDEIVFNWLSEPSRTITLNMRRSDIEADYKVMASFSYEGGASDRLTILTWIERRGLILPDPTSCRVDIYDLGGNLVATRNMTSRHATGVFHDEWNNVTATLQYGVTYYAKVALEYSGSLYESAVTYMLRLSIDQQDKQTILNAIGESQVSVSNILDNVSSNLGTVATNVLGVASNLEAMAVAQSFFRSNVTEKLDLMTGTLDRVSLGMTNLLESMGTFTNDAASMLNAMTTNLDLMLPAITNLDARLPQLEADLRAARARILTRPNTVVYGSTNLILYKSAPGYGNIVTLTVSNDVQGEVYSGVMTEILNGIYQLDGLVADWGTNRYVVTCMDPPGAAARGWDSMGLTVVPPEQQAALAGLELLTNDLARIESRLTNLAASVQNIDTGLSTVVGDILVSVTNVEETLSGLTNLSDVATTLASVNWGAVSNIGTMAGTLTNILGRVINIEDVVGDLTNLAQAANALTNVNWDAVTNIASLAADLNTTMTSVTNIEAMIGGLADLASLTAAITNLTGALTNLPDLVAMGTNLNVLAQAFGGVDLNDLGDRVTNLISVVNGMGDLNALKDQITNMVAAVANMQDLNTLATNVSDLVAALGGVDLTALGGQITNLTALMSGLGDLTALQGQITNMVAAIENMQDLSVLGSNVASLVQSLGAVDLVDFGDRMTNLSAAISAIGDLSQLQADITNMVRVVDEMTDLNTLGSNVASLVQSLGAVDLAEFGTQMTNLTAIMSGLGDLTLLQDQITNMVAAIQNMQDLTVLGSNVATLVQSLGTVDLSDFSARMTNLTAAISSVGDLSQLQSDITNMVAAVNNMQDLSVLGSNVASLVQSMGGVDLNQLGTRITNLTAAIAGMADVGGIQASLSNVVDRLGDLTNLNALAGVDWSSITNLAGVATDVQTILASVTNTEQLVGDLTNLQSVASSLAGVDWSSISNLTGMAGDLQTILVSVTNTEEAVSDLTNLQAVVSTLAGVNWGAISNLAGVTTNVQSILATVTNTQQLVSSLTALLAFDFGAITNLPGIQQDLGDVRSVVTNLQAGLGALTGVDWGDISGTLANITNQMGAMQWNDITDLRTRMGNVQTTLTALPDVRTGVSNVWLAVSGMNWDDVDGLRNSMLTMLATVGGGNLGASVAEIRARLAGLDLSGVDALATQIGNPGDGAGTRTLFGQIAAVEKGLAQAGTDAEDAASKAGAARGEAAKAATAVQDLKAELAAGNLAGAAAKLDEIRDFMSRARESMGALESVPQGLGGLDTQLKQLNARFEQLAAAGGFRFTDGSGKPFGEGGDRGEGRIPPQEGETPPSSGALTQESLQSLSQRIDEVRDRMLFLQRMLEEMRDVPVVETTLLGAP